MSNNQTLISDIESASKNIDKIIIHTKLEYSARLSKQYDAKIYLKREDQQNIRSYKIRGAYNLISRLDEKQKDNGIVTASAGNHAQGVAFSAKKLKIFATIFMPSATQPQKINRVNTLGGKYIKIRLEGNNFDECNAKAIEYCGSTDSTFIPPFDNDLIIAGQGTVAKEIYQDLNGKLDIVLCPVGGGGLIAGTSAYLKHKNPIIEIIGVEPEGADAMNESLTSGHIVTLKTIDTFVDGAAVKQVGEKTFDIVRTLVNKMLVIPAGKICCAMIDLYQEDGIITEPAGAMAVASLDLIADIIKNKIVVCIISGGNNDIMRYSEIIERAAKYKKQFNN